MDKVKKDNKKKMQCWRCTHFKLTRKGWPLPYCELLQDNERERIQTMSSYVIENHRTHDLCPLEDQELKMHHKRGKKKSARAGCSMCKPHKDNEFKGSYAAQTNQEKLSRDNYEDQLADLGYDETYDAFYCSSCKEWTESKCSDPHCGFCASRPEKAI